jgi:hypothetical protein
MTDQELTDKIIEKKLLKGPWKEETHEQRHKRLFNNLVEIVSDLEHSDVELPRSNNVIDWSGISILFLLQWTNLNSQKITHEHGELIETDKHII